MFMASTAMAIVSPAAGVAAGAAAGVDLPPWRLEWPRPVEAADAGAVPAAAGREVCPEPAPVPEAPVADGDAAALADAAPAADPPAVDVLPLVGAVAAADVSPPAGAGW